MFIGNFFFFSYLKKCLKIENYYEIIIQIQLEKQFKNLNFYLKIIIIFLNFIYSYHLKK